MGRKPGRRIKTHREIVSGIVFVAILAASFSTFIAYVALGHNPMGEYCFSDVIARCDVSSLSLTGFLAFILTSPYIVWQELGLLVGIWFVIGFASFLSVFLIIFFLLRGIFPTIMGRRNCDTGS